jgi:transposase
MARWAQKRRDTATLEERRLRSLTLLDQGHHQAEVAEMVGVSPQAVNQWMKCAEVGGRTALRAIPRSGRPPYVTEEIAGTILEIIGNGALHYGYSTDLWTLPRLREVVEKEWGVRYSKTGLWGLLKAHHVSWQRPRRQAREKDVRAVRNWKRYSYPRLKKKPLDGAP